MITQVPVSRLLVPAIRTKLLSCIFLIYFVICIDYDFPKNNPSKLTYLCVLDFFQRLVFSQNRQLRTLNQHIAETEPLDGKF
jgi:hypothetical protein